MKKRRARARGFTLIELILVMAVLLAVSAVLAPRFSDFFPSLQVRKTADHLFAWARKARADAAETGARQRLVVDTERKVFWIEREPKPLKEPGKFEALGGGWVEEALPSGMDFDVLEGFETDRTDSKRRYIEFWPDGTATEAELGIANEQGDRRIIKVLAATSKITIENPAVTP